jgi:hypothetical protein
LAEFAWRIAAVTSKSIRVLLRWTARLYVSRRLPMMSMLAAISDFFVWWQLPLVAVLVGLIVFMVWYRKRQY